jgi:hypothetical protein
MTFQAIFRHLLPEIILLRSTQESFSRRYESGPVARRIFVRKGLLANLSPEALNLTNVIASWRWDI